MKQIWKTAVISFFLLGLAGITIMAAIGRSVAHKDARIEGHTMMVQAHYRLAMDLGR